MSRPSWTITGGTILSGKTTLNVKVQWNNVGSRHIDVRDVATDDGTYTLYVSNLSGGTLSPSSTCSTSGTFTLSGQAGSIQRWEKSVDEGIHWTAINTTTASYSYSNIYQRTKFRAVIGYVDENGVSCTPFYSSWATVNAVPAPPTPHLWGFCGGPFAPAAPPQL